MRRRAAAVGAAILVVALAGCATDDPAEIDAQASGAFDGLVAAAAEIDSAVLRTLSIDPATTQSCGDGGEQIIRSARGTVSVGAGVAQVAALAELQFAGGALDPERWDEIDPAQPGVQRAWADDDGIIATVRFEDPLLVIAVFSPCVDG
ncbi:hypothetical protein GCM10009808_16400 [Microbacterium sediminicola]|uniref:Uncharacterized protein n=1 Tax=Microbacterium sediminicola TaxID=415210 RepID=A0ABN2I7F7_9MICO